MEGPHPLAILAAWRALPFGSPRPVVPAATWTSASGRPRRARDAV